MFAGLKTLLRLNGPLIALLGLALLMGYENLGKELPRYGLMLYTIPIWAGIGTLILQITAEKPVAINPQPPTAQSHAQDRQRLLKAAGFVSALFLLHLVFLNDQPSLLDSGFAYSLFAAAVIISYAILLLNSMERAQPGTLKQKATLLAPWDYPALLAAGLLMTLLYPLDPNQTPVLDGLLALCITFCAGVLYAEHRGVYQPRPPAEPAEPAKPAESPELPEKPSEPPPPDSPTNAPAEKERPS